MKENELQSRLQAIDARMASRDFVKETVALRYPETDKALRDNPKAESIYKAFSYVRGMPIFLRDGPLDMEFAHQMMISPSASVQVLERAKIESDSRVLEMFSGFGYLTVFLAVANPKQIICGDLFTPKIYNLSRTFKEALNYIYEKNIPKYTQPEWVRLDVTKTLPFQKSSFDKILLNPPYGRGSKGLLPFIGEGDAKHIWVSSIKHSRGLLKDSNSEIISIVPFEWADWLKEVPIPGSVHEVTTLKETQQFPIGMVVTKF